MKPHHVVAVIAALSGACTATAETTLLLDVAFGIRYVSPSNVSVPVGEYLTIRAPGKATNAQWFKNGKPILGAVDGALVIPSVAAEDSGIYQYAPTDLGIPERGTQLLLLNVGPNQRFVNLSTRAFAGTGEQTLIGGFVVTGEKEKKVLIRAIGPSLAKFGIAGFLREPVITIFDSTGEVYKGGFVYVAVVGAEEMAIADATRRCGAFPLEAGAKDAVAYRPFPHGSYTVHITSKDGSSGIALLEVYEVP